MTEYIELAGWRVQLANRLTAKEAEAIALAAAGKTAKEAARVLGTSTSEINGRLERANKAIQAAGASNDAFSLEDQP